METNKENSRKPAGRKWAKDPAVHRYGIKLNGGENARFTSLFLQSGMNEKAKFIKNMISGTEMKMARIETMIEGGKVQLLVDVSHGNRELFLKPELQSRREKIPPGNSGGTGK